MAEVDSGSDEVGMAELLGPLGTDPPAAGHRRAGAIAVRVGFALLAVVVLGIAGLVWSVTRATESAVHTMSVGALHATVARPPAPLSTAAGTPLTVLLLGSDQRVGADAGGGVTGQRADAIMLVRFSADRGRIDVLSIPRDSWVPIPGRGTTKINASLAGGPSLVVATVEQLTGIRIDHVVLVHFDGVRDMTTALGGVTVDNPTASTDPLTHTHFDAGQIVLSGDRALTYVRQRYGLPGGDFDRIDHQQELIAAIGHQLADAHLLANPALLARTVQIVADSLTVDDGLSQDMMTALIADIVSVQPSNLRFYTAPSAGFGRSAFGESYVRLDSSRLAAACSALRSDRPVPLPVTPIGLP